jgi:hypothetical protein
MKKDFTYGDFAGANFSKYLVKETKKGDGKVLVFLKPCDTYSFNQLLTEHRFDREKVYAVGRTALEAKVLGCKILPYDPRFPDPDVWKIVNVDEAINLLQWELDEIDK